MSNFTFTATEANELDRQLKLRKAKAVVGVGIGRNVVRTIAADVPWNNGGDCAVVAYSLLSGTAYSAVERMAREEWGFRKNRGSTGTSFMEAVRQFVKTVPGRKYGIVCWYGVYSWVSGKKGKAPKTLRQLLKNEPLWTGAVITDHGKDGTHAIAVINGVPYNSFAKDWDIPLVSSCFTGRWWEAY